MRAGDLTHRIDFEQPALAKSTGGAVLRKWEPFRQNVPASVEPLSGRELFLAQSLNSETTHKVTLRFLPGITQLMRIVFQGRIFDIVSIANKKERNREIEIIAKEGRSAGN